ncbi:hypothetical protein XO10_08130 [Marinitoga sp. 1135]|uniref:Uncharacterized protein n=1 Tax=Marinitoga piezophila (strain DSM 14283 / JCM 11233 / KA3) TaxID=443254 RepID=H2J522_MARPK|nr:MULTISPECIES: hypothetical protein [Marinitoga]AEX86039.1 hypothetical protein Marpi_1650 [Marinitoga piezophila KA3]APT76462.1 hypothetical protein LN42_08790 [Marinitoga sp. 1137]NUU96223.1 hypothetical protein [Marinitoga sp. 1135]NUU98146.1 hypothetical protein [Marinitoga sp. 1138]
MNIREYWFLFPITALILMIFSFNLENYNVSSQVIQPNKSIEINGIDIIKINYPAVRIKFDPESNKIYFSDKIILVKKENMVEVRSSNPSLFGSQNIIEIVIGTKKRYKNVIIDTASAEIYGKLNTEFFDIDSMNIKFRDFEINNNTEFKVDGTSVSIINSYIKTKKIYMDTTSLKFLNTLITADLIDLDGTTISVEGEINVHELYIDGTSVKLNFKCKNLKNIKISSTTLSGEIYYLDMWDGIRRLESNEISNNLIIYVKKENPGIIDFKGKIKKY